MNDIKQWKDGEVYFCLRVVQDQGTGNRLVPRDSVASYLDTQAVGAVMDGHAELAMTLSDAAEDVRAENWPSAEQRILGALGQSLGASQ